MLTFCKTQQKKKETQIEKKQFPTRSRNTKMSTFTQTKRNNNALAVTKLRRTFQLTANLQKSIFAKDTFSLDSSACLAPPREAEQRKPKRRNQKL